MPENGLPDTLSLVFAAASGIGAVISAYGAFLTNRSALAPKRGELIENLIRANARLLADGTIDKEDLLSVLMFPNRAKIFFSRKVQERADKVLEGVRRLRELQLEETVMNGHEPADILSKERHGNISNKFDEVRSDMTKLIADATEEAGQNMTMVSWLRRWF